MLAMNRALAIVPLLLAATLLAGCRSTASTPLEAPQWSELPAGVLDAFCGRAHSEGISKETPIVVIRTTQPIVNANALMAVRNAYFVQRPPAISPSETAEQLRTTLPAIPLAIPTDDCDWKAAAKLNPALHGDVMVLQLSNVFLNPYVKNQAGVLARFSLGNSNPQWYWIPFAHDRKSGRWGMGAFMMLNLRED